MRISRSVFVVGGVVLGGALIASTSPGTMRAVEAAAATAKATLVQVTNTASNPVVTRDVTLAPSQLVEVQCRDGLCVQLLPGGAIPAGSANYTVPAGQTLVITDIDIRTVATATGGTSSFAILPVSGTCSSCGSLGQPLTYDMYDVPYNDETHHFSLGRGIVWPSGAAIQSEATSGGTLGTLYGYLTTN